MRKGTKIALAAGAMTILGAAGLSTLAIADNRSSGGWGQHGGGHGSGMGHKGRGAMRMMERFDANEDGKLTQAELDEARKKLLAANDGDKDGKLSLAEFEKLWLDFMRQRMVRGFQRIDRDGDALITVDEFLKPYANIIVRMDRNEDGVLDSQDRPKKHGGMGMGPHGGMGGMGKKDDDGGMGQGGGMKKRGG